MYGLSVYDFLIKLRTKAIYGEERESNCSLINPHQRSSNP